MRILFDHQIYNNQNYGGISRYFYELGKGLISNGMNVDNSIYFSENEFVSDKSLYNSRKFLSANFKGKAKVKRYINQTISEFKIKSGSHDIFHPTYYDTYYIDKKLVTSPIVVTFYDLTHEKFSDRYPDTLTNIDLVIKNRRKILENADCIIAISHSTKQDIIDYYGTDPSKIHVTHLSSSTPGETVPDTNALGEYILFVGNRDGYKNFSLFIEAVQPLTVTNKGLKIVCAGGGAFKESELKLIQTLGLAKVIIQIPINDNTLLNLYKNALFFVFPSLYEGFGIPVLEAFNAGCPAILSKTSSLPEVGGDAALYIDPEQPASILQQAANMLNDESLRRSCVAKGYKQAETFSWQKMTSETIDIYNSLL